MALILTMLSFLPLIFKTLLGLFTSSSASTVATVAETAVEPFLNPGKMLLRLGCVLAVVAAIGGTWWYIDHLQSELSVAQSQTTAALAVNADQKTTLDLCTDNTKQLKKDADDWAVKAAAAEAKASKKAAKSYDQAKAILSAKPAPGQSDSDAADELLNSLIPDRGNQP